MRAEPTTLSTMEIVVRLFAGLREKAGTGECRLELPDGSRVSDVWVLLALGEQPPGLLYAVNREYAERDRVLAEGDEVALIPPVSGGAMTIAPILVSASPLSVDDALAAVRDSGFGGVVVFLGTVRDRSRGKRVTHLEYEAYAEMAEVKMREIAQRLEREHAPLRVVMHHRVGDLAIGEIAVIVAAGAPHRDAAFVAARAAIDELKTVVPIWKKEHSDDGAIWIEDHA